MGADQTESKLHLQCQMEHKGQKHGEKNEEVEETSTVKPAMKGSFSCLQETTLMYIFIQ